MIAFLAACAEPVDGWVAPENTWDVATPPEDLDGQGFVPGRVAEDLRLVDQLGDPVSLWQFYGEVIALDVVETSYADCLDLGPLTEEIWQDYRDDGFVYVTLLVDRREGVDQRDLERWADSYGITAPVVRDPFGQDLLAVTASACDVLVIGRDLVVRDHAHHVEDRVREAIEAAL
jgi:hypothetical protein